VRHENAALKALLIEAERRASSVVARYGLDIEALGRIEDVAETLGVEVYEGGIRGAQARLVVSGDSVILRVREGELRTPRGRFSLAHELGHHQLNSTTVSCSAGDMRHRRGQHLREATANRFAACLLLPSALVSRLCDTKPSIESVRSIASLYTVSLTATALRFVELCPHPCAVSLSTSGQIDFAITNDSVHLPVREEGPLGRASLASRHFRSQAGGSGPTPSTRRPGSIETSANGSFSQSRSSRCRTTARVCHLSGSIDRPFRGTASTGGGARTLQGGVHVQSGTHQGHQRCHWHGV